MLEWNDFQVILAVHQNGTLSGAARVLKVHQSTISRALQRIESRLQTRIFSMTSGRYEITPPGGQFLKAAEGFNGVVNSLRYPLSPGSTVSGRVRVSSIEALLSKFLIPRLPDFKSKFPRIGIELNGSNENQDLLRRDYDVSLRFGRESKLGSLIQKRVSMIGIGAYSHKALAHEMAKISKSRLSWIGYEGALSAIPEEKWLRNNGHSKNVSFRASSYLSMENFIEQGMGVGLIPNFIGNENPELQKVAGLSLVLERPLWLISHPEARRDASVEHFVRWATQMLDADKKLLTGR